MKPIGHTQSKCSMLYYGSVWPKVSISAPGNDTRGKADRQGKGGSRNWIQGPMNCPAEARGEGGLSEELTAWGTSIGACGPQKAMPGLICL